MTEPDFLLEPESFPPEPPFVGRQAVFARLKQHILDSPDRKALLFVGRNGVGKSSLLDQFGEIFGDPFISLVVRLDSNNCANGTALAQALATAMKLVLEPDHEHSEEANEPDHAEIASWEAFQDDYLADVMQGLRSQRRLIWLLDDGHYLLDTDDDLITLLAELLQEHERLSIILTLNSAHEDRLREFNPLINIDEVEQLGLLSEEDSTEFIQHFAPGADEAFYASVYAESGGNPRLLHQLGSALQAVWETRNSDDAIKHSRSIVYEQNQGQFEQLWYDCRRDEQLVLTAIANLIYEGFQRDISIKRLEGWLIETDDPLDDIAISAALRGLEYRDIVIYQRAIGIQIRSELFKTWLLEHARLERIERKKQPGTQINWRVMAFIGLVVIIALIILLRMPSPVIQSSDPVATVTLDR